MSGLEQNLDAYAVLADILYTLRERIGKALESRYPEGWHREPSLAPLVDRLIARKEREKAIDWYSSEYQALIEFTSFEDILEILEKHEDLIPQLKVLVPSPHLLHARMLELEALREKLAMARAVTENELSFLTTFHQRFRKVIDEPETPASPAAPPSPAPEVPESATEDGGEKEETGGRGKQEAKADTVADEAKDAGDETPQEPETTGAGPKRSPAPPGEKRDQRNRAPVSAPRAAAAPAADTEPIPAAEANTISAAIENGDTQEILRFLYREVTAIADGLFSSDTTPAPVYWKAVRGSAWYEENFSPLGLKPLSDFYAIVDEAIEKRREGADREAIQEFLKGHNFAKILLGLRDMFQRNRL